MTCKDCQSDTATYNSKCIGCQARFILRMDKPLRLAEIERSGFDVEKLKEEVIRRSRK